MSQVGCLLLTKISKFNWLNIFQNHFTALKQSPSVAGDCSTVRIQTFKFPKREELQQLQSVWLSHLEYVPVGNQKSDSAWEAALKDQSMIVDEAERKLQEEKKFKLRKAMADSTLIDELPQVRSSVLCHLSPPSPVIQLRLQWTVRLRNRYGGRARLARERQILVRLRRPAPQARCAVPVGACGLRH